MIPIPFVEAVVNLLVAWRSNTVNVVSPSYGHTAVVDPQAQNDDVVRRPFLRVGDFADPRQSNGRLRQVGGGELTARGQ